MKQFFTTNDGKVVIGQKPNAPILVWAITTLLARIITTTPYQALFEHIAFGSLFVWGWLELFQGVNLFRRMLGAAALIGLLYLRVIR